MHNLQPRCAVMSLYYITQYSYPGLEWDRGVRHYWYMYSVVLVVRSCISNNK